MIDIKSWQWRIRKTGVSTKDLLQTAGVPVRTYYSMLHGKNKLIDNANKIELAIQELEKNQIDFNRGQHD